MKNFLSFLALTLILCSPSIMADGAKQKDPTNLETITFGAGCFWCVEAVFQRLDGVESAVSGYMGGEVENPTYEQVCSGQTGHAEVIQVRYNPSEVSTRELIDFFWLAHDPTTLNRQGADRGTQYRSAIFYHSEEQRRIAEESKQTADESGQFNDPIVTEITQASEFYPAEDYHQEFYELNKTYPYCRAVITPKLKKLGLKD